MMWDMALSEEHLDYEQSEREGLLSKYDHFELKPRYCIISILRAADAMLFSGPFLQEGFGVGKMLIQRNEESKEKEPVIFYKKLVKNIDQKTVFLVDPMMGTGQSIEMAIQELKKENVKEENIRVIVLITCPDGLKRMTTKHPKITFFVAQIDDELNADKYIVPGLGDMGDRFFGTV